MIELLAPAKNLECGIAAIDHGADAVYIGARSFGARHAVGNSTEDIKQLCKYAHIFNAKVYATVNTVIYDEEMDEAEKLVDDLKAAGVDAILVQDMGLLARIIHKGMELHASTQTDNRTAEKTRWMKGLGFSRVVLARELSIDEISKIHKQVPDVELEVFVHGALCVSFSGQCYASEYCKDRSANRGQCAQMCRMKYTLKDAGGNRIADDAYYLSLKDQAQIDNLEQLISAGAVSLKIEGRLKDITYVKNVVAAYSKRLDEIISRHNKQRKEGEEEWRRASWGETETTFVPDLERSYNRGYTTYFANGRKGGMASLMTPKAIGQYVGRMKEYRAGRQPSFNVSSTAAFVNGDGLCFIDRNGDIQGFRVNRAEGNRLYPLNMPKDLVPGTALYRSQDKAFDTLLEGKTATRQIPVSLRLSDSGNSIRLSVDGADGIGLHGEAEAIIEERQEAMKPQRENIVKQITKLGGTPYKCSSISVDDSLDRVFIPSSVLADLRRRAVADVKKKPERASSATGGAKETIWKNEYGDRFAYLYNADNQEARNFLIEKGIGNADGFKHAMATDSLNDGENGALLMQCRYCIRHELGFCVKNGGRRPTWKEPLALSLADGTAFTLGFDCKRCQMNVYR